MPKRHKLETLEFVPAPEPEGQGDWLYICTGCGYQRKADASFCQNCPKCRGSRWSAYWLTKPSIIERLGDATASPRPSILQTELLPLDQTANPRPGPKIPPLSDGLIKKLADQGLGVKAIASKLSDQGIVVSHMTIQRRLQAMEVT